MQKSSSNPTQGESEVVSKSDNLIANLLQELLPSGYELLPGVNQFYELNLAISEFRALSKEQLIKRSAFFQLVDGVETTHYKMCVKSRLELGSSSSIWLKSFFQAYQFKTGYATHGLFPYRGKFHPQLIKALINLIGIGEKDTVLDPMMGSGTLNIEASLMGIRNIGIDISPFCVLMAKAKVDALTLSPLPLQKCTSHPDKIFSYFHKIGTLDTFTQQEIELEQELSLLEDERYRNLLLLCYLDSLGYSVRRKGRSADQLFPNLLKKYVTLVSNFAKARDELGLNIGDSLLTQGDARNLKELNAIHSIKDEAIDGIITSPPYSFAIDYIKGDKRQLEYLGYSLGELQGKMIGLRGSDNEGKLANYLFDMKKVISEMYRVLKNGKYCVIVIGSNSSQLQKIASYLKGIRLEDELLCISKECGFSLSQRISRPIEGMRNTMRNEEILILKK